MIMLWSQVRLKESDSRFHEELENQTRQSLTNQM